MMNVVRVALLTRHVDFTIKAKHALETRDGRYFVTAFTSVQNLTQFLTSSEQDIAILDLTVRDVVPDRLILRVRELQPHIGIVVAPNHPAVLSALASLNIQGIIDIPMPTRQLLGFMAKLIQAPKDLPHVLMPNAADIVETPDVSGEPTAASGLPPSPEAEALFQRLAAEEPPMPTFEESATIADAVENFIALPPAEQLEVLLQSAPEVTTLPAELPAASLATHILETVLDHSTPVSAVMNRVRERLTNEDIPGDNREPDFLEALPPAPLEYGASTTAFSQQHPPDDANDLATARLEPIVRSRPVLEGDFASLEDLRPEPAAAPPPPYAPPAAPQPPAAAVLLATGGEPNIERDIAQLAITLTEMSVETAADAVFLVHEGQIAAYSGRLPRAEVETLQPSFAAPWDTEKRTTIDFVRLEATSTDYVLHGVLTEAGCVLYLLFAGAIPISAIRRQGRALSAALAAAPAAAEVVPLEQDEAFAPLADGASAEDVIDPPTLQPYNFVWVLRDAGNPLTNDSARSLVQALNSTLRQRTWRVRAIDVYSDFVHLRADLPPAQGAARAVRDAMRASAELLLPTTPTWANALWSDSYLVVPSARELDLAEIQSFIRFARA